MSRWSGDKIHCVKCDRMLGYVGAPGTEDLAIGSAWCNACKEAADRVTCFDCNEWISRADGHVRQVDTARPGGVFYFCDACYRSAIDDDDYYDQESVRWQCLTPQEQEAEERARQHLAGAAFGWF